MFALFSLLNLCLFTILTFHCSLLFVHVFIFFFESVFLLSFCSSFCSLNISVHLIDHTSFILLHSLSLQQRFTLITLNTTTPTLHHVSAYCLHPGHIVFFLLTLLFTQSTHYLLLNSTNSTLHNHHHIHSSIYSSNRPTIRVHQQTLSQSHNPPIQ